MSKVAKKANTQAETKSGFKAETKSGFKVKKLLTLPVFSVKDEGSIVVVKIMEAMYQGKPLAGQDEKEKPADICNVMNLKTGEMGQLIVPAVLKSKFEVDYEGDDYVGRGFEIENLGKKKGKTRTYNDYRITEVEIDG